MKKGFIAVISSIVGAIGAGVAVGMKESANTAKQKEFADKHLNILQNMNQWIILKQKGISLEPYFKEHKYNRIAIYGMSYLGERLLDDLKETEIEVAYGIDKNADNLYADVDIISPEDEFLPVDAIVVTATFYFDEICDNLQSKVSCPIISLEDVLYDY